MKKITFVALAFLGILLFLFTAFYLLPMFNESDDTVSKMLCKGLARCFEGVVDDIIDGDTLEISGETVRLALVNTPEKWEDDYEAAIDFVWELCPIGSEVVVDEDDVQTSGSHRRMVAVVYYNSEGRFRNLNEELLEAGYAMLLEDFCEKSEFSNEEWARLYGCE